MDTEQNWALEPREALDPHTEYKLEINTDDTQTPIALCIHKSLTSLEFCHLPPKTKIYISTIFCWSKHLTYQNIHKSHSHSSIKHTYSQTHPHTHWHTPAFEISFVITHAKPTKKSKFISDYITTPSNKPYKQHNHTLQYIPNSDIIVIIQNQPHINTFHTHHTPTPTNWQYNTSISSYHYTKICKPYNCTQQRHTQTNTHTTHT